MPPAEPGSGTFDFRLTARQRRLRYSAAIIIVALLLLVGTGLRHPFFRSVGSPTVRDLARTAIQYERAGRTPPPEAERARRAVTVRLTVIAAYWTLCFSLSAVLVLLAWMDVREIRRKLMDAHSRALRRLASQGAQRHGDGHQPPPA